MQKQIAHLSLGALLLATGLNACAQPAQRYNCREIAEHRQFDFWVGTWTVTDEAGSRTFGSNRIRGRDSGCMLLEEYRTAGGFSGSSINFFNPSDGRWHQHWVDNGTSIITTSGGLSGSSMQMTGTIYYLADKRTAAFRGTWTPLPDGRVRQFFEEQDEQGQWNTWFDGYYRRVEQ